MKETELVQSLTRVSHGKSGKQVMAIVQGVVDEKGLKKSVSNSWWESTCCFNPVIFLQAAAPLSMGHAKATYLEILHIYFDLLECTLDHNDLKGKTPLSTTIRKDFGSRGSLLSSTAWNCKLLNTDWDSCIVKASDHCKYGQDSCKHLMGEAWPLTMALAEQNVCRPSIKN